MRKKILFSLALISVGAVSACAGVNLDLLPSLEQRTLAIAPDLAGFEYQYEVCVSHFLWCHKKEMRRDTYDLADPEMRKKLILMGFVAKVREKK